MKSGIWYSVFLHVKMLRDDSRSGFTNVLLRCNKRLQLSVTKMTHIKTFSAAGLNVWYVLDSVHFFSSENSCPHSLIGIQSLQWRTNQGAAWWTSLAPRRKTTSPSLALCCPGHGLFSTSTSARTIWVKDKKANWGTRMGPWKGPAAAC